MVSGRVQHQIDRLLDQAEAVADDRDWSLVMDKARAVLAMQHLGAAGELFSHHGAKLSLDQVLANKELLGA